MSGLLEVGYEERWANLDEPAASTGDVGHDLESLPAPSTAHTVRNDAPVLAVDFLHHGREVSLADADGPLPPLQEADTVFLHGHLETPGVGLVSFGSGLERGLVRNQSEDNDGMTVCLGARNHCRAATPAVLGQITDELH